MGRRHKGPLVPLTESALRKLSTPRLLAYQDRVRRLHEAPWNDPDKVYLDRNDPNRVAFSHKDDPLYVAHRELLRRLLSEREHVPR